MADELAHPDRSHGGAATHISPAELIEICTAHLSDPECGSVSALARRFDRKRETIARCLKTPEYKRLKDEVFAARRDEILSILQQGAARAATLWSTKTLDSAAERGSHQAMKDLLLHSRLIDPVVEPDAGPKVIVQVGVSADQVTLSPVSMKEP
jgi:hypothetical protein